MGGKRALASNRAGGFFKDLPSTRAKLILPAHAVTLAEVAVAAIQSELVRHPSPATDLFPADVSWNGHPQRTRRGSRGEDKKRGLLELIPHSVSQPVSQAVVSPGRDLNTGGISRVAG